LHLYISTSQIKNRGFGTLDAEKALKLWTALMFVLMLGLTFILLMIIAG